MSNKYFFSTIGHKSVSIISGAEINHKSSRFNIGDICEFFKDIKE